VAYPPRIHKPAFAFDNVFGALGAEHYVTGHWTAGPQDTSDKHAISLFRSYHQAHKAKNWGGAGYHYGITRAGNIVLLRPTALKGAHVGGKNSNNVGVVCHGTIGNAPNASQRRAFKWLLSHAHTRAMPSSHRTDRDLRVAKRMGHNDWSGHESNQCPGTYKRLYLSGGTTR